MADKHIKNNEKLETKEIKTMFKSIFINHIKK